MTFSTCDVVILLVVRLPPSRSTFSCKQLLVWSERGIVSKIIACMMTLKFTMYELW